MQPNRRLAALLLPMLMLALPAMALAERMDRFGDYEIHYNAMPTTWLQPSVARAYNLQRSRVQGLVMITVLRDGQPVEAGVRGNAYTDSGQQRDIRFRQVEEADSIYYLGTYRIQDKEMLRFELSVRPEMGDRSHPLGFRERFFVD